MGKVGYKVKDSARWELPLELTTEVPDTENTDFPGGGTVRPTAVGLGITVNRETGEWEVWSASVVGPKVKDGKVSTKRDYAIPFTSPLDGEGGSDVAPEWLREICQEWVDRANGISTNSPARGGQVDELVKRQIKMAQEALERDAKDLATRYMLWAEPPIRLASSESSRLQQDSERVALAAARLDGMREVASMFINEEN